MRHGRRPAPRWWPWLGLFMAIGLAIRLATVYSPNGQGGRRGRLLLLQRRQAPGERARLHQPLPVHPPRGAPRRAVGGLPPALHPGPGHPVRRRPEELPGGAGLVLHSGHRGHRRLRLHRARDRRAEGGAHRRLPAGRLPEHLDDRRAGAVRGAGAPAGGHAAALRLPVLEGAGHQAGDMARRCHGHRHAGTGRAHVPGRLPRRPAGAPGPGAQLETALRRPRDRALGHGTRRGALGRVQPEPVPKAGLHHPPDWA